MIKKLRYYLHPSFIEKMTIKSSIYSMVSSLNSSLNGKSLLDIGCGSQPYRELFEQHGVNYEGIDFNDYSVNKTYSGNPPDYFFSDTYTKDFLLKEIKDSSYDLVTAFQVLEHHQEPEVFFSEVSRILKRDGIFLLTFPFIWELHEEPHDYQRLTHYQLDSLANKHDLSVSLIIKRGGTLSVVSQLINLGLLNGRLPKLISVPLYLVTLMPLQFALYFIDSLFQRKERTIFLGYSAILRKK